jgi:hypothetical protein
VEFPFKVSEKAWRTFMTPVRQAIANLHCAAV